VCVLGCYATILLFCFTLIVKQKPFSMFQKYFKISLLEGRGMATMLATATMMVSFGAHFVKHVCLDATLVSYYLA
jgi:hypothetical protein